MVTTSSFKNPFRPGAGHYPPYLAGREEELREFERLLQQETILDNVVLTGLRGVGKTVLLETFKPLALKNGWLWAGTDLSESSSISEENLSVRLMTDLAVVTSALLSVRETITGAGLGAPSREVERGFDYSLLLGIWQRTPGLAEDKLKTVLETVWEVLKPLDRKGIIFAYDEAQNLADHPEKNTFPLALLLDVFQSIQRKGVPFMLVLTGLPTLFPKLVESRTFAERMFHVISLERLNEANSREAIVKPIEEEHCPIRFSEESITSIYNVTRGYPYFIQYVCRDVFDIWVQCAESGKEFSPVPFQDIMRKLDQDFFAGRWARATDRQRDLLGIIARLPNAAAEFSVQEIVEASRRLLDNPFTSSHANQMLVALSNAGLVYKNRWGKYSLAVPLLDGFIRRKLEEAGQSV